MVDQPSFRIVFFFRTLNGPNSIGKNNTLSPRNSIMLNEPLHLPVGDKHQLFVLIVTTGLEVTALWVTWKVVCPVDHFLTRFSTAEPRRDDLEFI